MSYVIGRKGMVPGVADEDVMHIYEKVGLNFKKMLKSY